jgi:hypothetical protein
MIRGVVRDQRGRPAARSKVRTLDRRHAALTDRCGQYELGPLPLGPVHVEAVDDHEIGRTTAPLTVTSGEIARAEIGLSTGSELRILAVGPGGSPVLPRRFSIVDAHGDTPSGHAYLLRTDKVPSEPIQSWDELLYELSEAGDRPYFSIRPRSGVIGVFPLLPGTYTIRAVMNDDGPSITRVVEVGSEPLYEVRLD